MKKEESGFLDLRLPSPPRQSRRGGEAGEEETDGEQTA